MGKGGSSLFMFAITKQFDQRDNDECQLAQITKGQLESHKRHPSLRVGLRAFSYQENYPHTGTKFKKRTLRVKPSTVMAAPEPHIAVRQYSTKFSPMVQD